MELYHNIMEQLIKQIKEHLLDYLDLYSIQIDKSNPIVCLNPEHDDAHPSMHLFYHRDGYPKLHCFACDADYDTIDVAIRLENLSSDSEDFIEAIRVIGRQLNMEVPESLNYNTEELERTTKFRKIYRAAAKFVRGNLTEDNLKYLENHMVSPEIAKLAGLGNCTLTKLQKHLEEQGFEEEVLQLSGIMNPVVFNESSLIIPIYDHRKRVLTFTARLKEGSKPKYLSCKSPLGTIKKTLYGIDRVKDIEGTELFVVEGQMDVNALHSLNPPLRAVGLNGLEMSTEQAEQLRRLAPSKITFLLDGDKPAKEATFKRLIPTIAKEQIIPVPKFMLLHKKDPCDYIREGGDLEEKYRYSLIDTYALSRGLEPETSIEHLIDKLIDIISQYSSPISRDIICSQLAERSGVAEASIKLALEKIDKEKATDIQKEQESLVKGIIGQLREDPAGASFTLQDALTKIHSASYNYDAVSSQSFASIVTQIKLNEEDPEKFPGFELLAFPELEEALRGSWSGKFIVVAGDENSGKSSYAAALLFDIISNPNNNAMGIVHSTDDSLEEALQKYVCLADQKSGKGKLQYINVKNPYYDTDNYASTKEIAKDREIAYDEVLSLIHDERLIIKDLAVSNSVGFTEELISYYRKKYPGREIVLLLDSFNRTGLPNATVDARMNATRLSNICASISIRYKCTLISVNEFNRPQDRNPEKIIWPTTKRLAEARAIEYDAKAIILLYNDLHSRTRQYADILWKDKYLNLRPRVAAIIAKNKISNPKPTMYYDFDEIRCKFIPVDEYTVKVERLQVAKDRADQNNNLTAMVNQGSNGPFSSLNVTTHEKTLGR